MIDEKLNYKVEIWKTKIISYERVFSRNKKILSLLVFNKVIKVKF